MEHVESNTQYYFLSGNFEFQFEQESWECQHNAKGYADGYIYFPDQKVQMTFINTITSEQHNLDLSLRKAINLKATPEHLQQLFLEAMKWLLGHGKIGCAINNW